MYYISKDLKSCFRITLNNHVKQFIIPLQHDLNRFCTTQLLSSNAFSQNVDKNIQTEVIWTCMAKAFDSVDH